MSKLFHFLRVNNGFILLVVNTLLLFLLFFLYDPFHLFKHNYNEADLVLVAEESELREIEIIDPNIVAGRVVLKKGSLRELPKKSASTEDDVEAPPKYQLLYNWDFALKKNEAASARTESYQADFERVAALFEELKEMRRYYSINSTPKRDRELNMEKEGDQALRLIFRFEGERSETLYLGRSQGGNSHVRLNDESEIFLVRTNLKNSTGSGNPYYFRNRRIIAPEITEENVTVLSARFKKASQNVQLSRTGKEWQLVRPVNTRANDAAVNSLLKDIVGWRATDFPEELPRKLNRKKAFQLEITYNRTLTEPATVTLDILGTRDYSTYYLRDERGVLYEISSVFLNDFFDARNRFVANGSDFSGSQILR